MRRRHRSVVGAEGGRQEEPASLRERGLCGPVAAKLDLKVPVGTARGGNERVTVEFAHLRERDGRVTAPERDSLHSLTSAKVARLRRAAEAFPMNYAEPFVEACCGLAVVRAAAVRWFVPPSDAA